MSYSNNSRSSNKPNSKDISRAVANADAVTRHLMTLSECFTEAAKGTPHITFARECVFAKHAINNSNYLTDIAMINPRSFEVAFLQLATSGLTLDPSQKQAYLVARNNRVILDVSYIGLSRMATDEGLCEDIVVDLVFDNDEFESKGRRTSPIHKYDPFGDKGSLLLTPNDSGVVGKRGNFRGVFVDYGMKDNRNLVYFLTIQDIAAARAVSESWKKIEKRDKSPWTNFPWKMVLKSAIKQTVHLIPGNRTKITAVIDYLNTIGEEGFKATGAMALEAAEYEMTARQNAHATTSESSSPASTNNSKGNIIEGDFTRTDQQPETQNTEPANIQPNCQTETSQEKTSEPVDLSRNNTDVRNTTVLRMNNIVKRVETTLAYETMLAEVKTQFDFNQNEIVYAIRRLEESRRKLLQEKVTQAVNDCDFSNVNSFVEKLSDSEFKTKTMAFVSSLHDETNRLRSLLDSAIQSRDFSQIDIAVEEIRFEPLKLLLTNVISDARQQ